MVGSDVEPKALLLGDKAPNFTADSSHGPITLHDYGKGHWVVLFSQPQDFTPVCTTEIGRVAHMEAEWAKRKTKVLAVSCDTTAHHIEWIKDVNETQRCQTNFPIIADPDRAIARLYGMLGAEGMKANTPYPVRSLFVIDPDHNIKLTLSYPVSTGRNFDEILRVMDSLQLSAEKKVATPADWKRGDKVVILPCVTDEEATELFGAYETIKPYLRLTKDPSN